ncbi:MAG TPA: hypothetical protein VH475_01510 [Tepidisphaeraceae bacterium]
MDSLGLLFLLLFVPGLLILIAVVAIALPRALRDEKRREEEGDDTSNH